MSFRKPAGPFFVPSARIHRSIQPHMHDAPSSAQHPILSLTFPLQGHAEDGAFGAGLTWVSVLTTWALTLLGQPLGGPVPRL